MFCNQITPAYEWLALTAAGAISAGLMLPVWRAKAHTLSAHLGMTITAHKPFRLLSVALGAVFGVLSAACFPGILQGAASLVLILCLASLSWIDLETRLLPNFLTLPLAVAGLAVNGFALFTTFLDAILGALGGYILLWLANALYRKTRGRDGLGGGDAKLLGALGSWLGWEHIPSLLMISTMLSILAWGLTAISLGRTLRSQAFGPYLSLSGLAVAIGGF